MKELQAGETAVLVLALQSWTGIRARIISHSAVSADKQQQWI